MVLVKTEQDVKDTISEFDIWNPKLPREDEFLPWTPLTNLLYHLYVLIPSCAVIMPVRKILTRQSVGIYQAVTGDNIEGGKGISEDVSEK